MKTGIVATIPGREKTLEIMKRSIIDQLDMLIVVYKSPSDGMKFFGADKLTGYVFILDDDIEYPPDYCDEMISAIEKYNHHAVICCSGKVMKRRPIDDFYQDVHIAYETFKEVKEDAPAEIPLTCAVAYHSDICVGLNESYFKAANMADIFLAIYCKHRQIPIMVKKRPANWLKNLMPELPENSYTIFDSFKCGTPVQTDLINRYL